MKVGLAATMVLAAGVAAQDGTPLSTGNDWVRPGRRVWDPHEVLMLDHPAAPRLLVFLSDYHLRFSARPAPAVLIPISGMRLKLTYSDGRTEEMAGKIGDAS